MVGGRKKTYDKSAERGVIFKFDVIEDRGLAVFCKEFLEGMQRDVINLDLRRVLQW